jgi:hypothetical protein
VTCRTAHSREMVEQVADGAAQVGFPLGTPVPDGITARCLYTVPLIWVAGHARDSGHPQPEALSWDIKEVEMTDMLIRDVPDDVVAALDAHAARLGLSRSEYVRRRLAQDAAVPGSAVTVQDLARFAEVFGDLDDPDVMSGAWE